MDPNVRLFVCFWVRMKHALKTPGGKLKLAATVSTFTWFIQMCSNHFTWCAHTHTNMCAIHVIHVHTQFIQDDA